MSDSNELVIHMVRPTGDEPETKLLHPLFGKEAITLCGEKIKAVFIVDEGWKEAHTHTECAECKKLRKDGDIRTSNRWDVEQFLNEKGKAQLAATLERIDEENERINGGRLRYPPWL
jgi:hypothetical protein